MELVLFIALAYALGSIPFGKIIGLRYGIDIQKQGSGNIGFANCLRILGWKPATVVLIGDVAKGLLPVFISSHFFPITQTLLVALASIIGHIFPFWLRFRGGKGIATGLGTLLVINPYIAFFGILVWLLVLTTTRLNSLASLFVIWSMPLVAFFVSTNLVIFCFVLLLLGTWTHRQNLNRLVLDKEKILHVNNTI